jgi:hypothetical protein
MVCPQHIGVCSHCSRTGHSHRLLVNEVLMCLRQKNLYVFSCEGRTMPWMRRFFLSAKNIETNFWTLLRCGTDLLPSFAIQGRACVLGARKNIALIVFRLVLGVFRKTAFFQKSGFFPTHISMSRIVSIQTEIRDVQILQKCLEELDCQVLYQRKASKCRALTTPVQFLVHASGGLVVSPDTGRTLCIRTDDMWRGLVSKRFCNN